MADMSRPVTSPESASVLETNDTTRAADVDSTNVTGSEPLGERDDSIRAHFRFLWVTVLVGCSLLEYGFDQGIIGSFQAMVGFLKVYGYEDPRVPSGWVSFFLDTRPFFRGCGCFADVRVARISPQDRSRSLDPSCYSAPSLPVSALGPSGASWEDGGAFCSV